MDEWIHCLCVIIQSACRHPVQLSMLNFAEECGCNRIGSYSNACDENGQCRCLPGVGGKKCDHCMSGFWGLHLIASGSLGCQRKLLFLGFPKFPRYSTVLFSAHFISSSMWLLGIWFFTFRLRAVIRSLSM